MSYPECKQYPCEDCPRAAQCPDAEVGVGALARRLEDIERRLSALEDWQRHCNAMLAAAVRCYERD